MTDARPGPGPGGGQPERTRLPVAAIAAFVAALRDAALSGGIEGALLSLDAGPSGGPDPASAGAPGPRTRSRVPVLTVEAIDSGAEVEHHSLDAATHAGLRAAGDPGADVTRLWVLLTDRGSVLVTADAGDGVGPAGGAVPVSWSFDPERVAAGLEALAAAASADEAGARAVAGVLHRYPIVDPERSLLAAAVGAALQACAPSDGGAGSGDGPALGELVAAAVHELNNPLATIGMAAGLIATADEDEERAHLAGLLGSQALRAGRIAGDLRAYLEDASLDREPTDVAELVGEVVAELAAQGQPVAMGAGLGGDAGEAGRGRVPGGAGSWARADREQVRAAVRAVVQTALEAPGRQAPVDVRVVAEHGEVVVAVEDDGEPVPEQLHDRYFEPFANQAPGGRGTGLGLAAAQRCAERHGGHVRLTRGATARNRVELRLPGWDPRTADDG